MQLRRLIPATVIATTAVAVALACVGLSGYHAWKARQALVVELQALGEVLSTQAIVALASEDAGSAEIMLLSLGARGDIDAAALFDADGKLLAQFLRDYDAGIAIPASPGLPGAQFASDSVHYVHAIQRGEERVGAIYLRASTERLAEMLKASLAIGGLVFALSLVPGMLAAARLVRSVARPLAVLAAASARTAAGDLRGELEAVDSGGEIGALSRAFGEMTGSLRGAVGDIVRGSSAIAQASAGLSAASERTVSQSERQQKSVHSMGASLSGMRRDADETTAQIEALTSLAGDVASCGREMQTITDSVSTALEQLFAAIEQNADAARGSANATAQVSQIAAALEQSAASSGASVDLLAGAIRSLRERAARSSERAAAAAEASRAGAGSARLTSSAMSAVSAAHGSLNQVVLELSGRSRAIEGVLQIVHDVIDATRLLSLNAAITAAQAGEHGAGFGVVAAQIRDLAGRTSASAGEIAKHVADLQKGITAAVEKNQLIETRIREGARQAEHTDAAFKHLLEAAGEFAAESAEISALADGQASALAQVTPTLDQVSEQVAEIEEALEAHGRAAEAIARSMDDARALASEVQGAMGKQEHAAKEVATAVDGLRKRVSVVQTAAAAQLEAVDSIREELVDVVKATEDSVELASGMRELVSSLGARAQELEGSAARFRLPEKVKPNVA